jgi:hypothetical protein
MLLNVTASADLVGRADGLRRAEIGGRLEPALQHFTGEVAAGRHAQVVVALLLRVFGNRQLN